MKRHDSFSLLLVAVVSSFPLNAAASDFNVLWTGLATLVIACMLAVIGIKASFVARAKARGEVIPYTLVIFLLVGIGLAIVFDEKDHMSKLDTYGMLGTVLVPGVLALLIPLLLSSSSASEKCDLDK